jgi:hypothetical protein
MGLGYDGKLYFLAFDHRGSFTKRFGIEGDPTPEETERIANGKHLIFEGLQVALDRGADPNVRASLRAQLEEGHGGGPLREYRNVTALSWGEQYHAQIFVSRESLRLIEARGNGKRQVP